MEINEIIIDAIKMILQNNENRYLIENAFTKQHKVELRLSFTYGKFARAKVEIQETGELWRIKEVV